MICEDNFKVLDDRAIVDPALKIFILLGRMHWEEEGWQVLHIAHDPDMRPGILARISEWEAADKAGDDEKKSRFGAFDFSDKIFYFFEFILRKVTEGDTLILEFLGPDEQYQRANLGSHQRRNLYDCPDRKAFLLCVFRNLLMIPFFQKWGFGKCKNAKLRMSAVKYALLEGRPTEGLSGDVILAERALEITH